MSRTRRGNTIQAIISVRAELELMIAAVNLSGGLLYGIRMLRTQYRTVGTYAVPYVLARVPGPLARVPGPIGPGPTGPGPGPGAQYIHKNY